jgi:hypothetical protein
MAVRILEKDGENKDIKDNEAFILKRFCHPHPLIPLSVFWRLLL